MKKLKRILLFILIFIGTYTSIGVINAETTEQTVRVGYFIMSGYQEYSNFEYSGYGYDYLQAIAQYTDWNYEYVQLSFNDCLTELAKPTGKIDILGSLQKTTEREELYDYADYESGTSYVNLFTLQNNTKYNYNDYENFNGIKVGLLKGNSRNAQLASFAAEKGFTYQIVKDDYESEEQMLADMNSGVIEASILSSIKRLDDAKILCQFNSSPFYFAVKKNSHLLLDLNDALERIKSTNPYFDMELYKLHYATISSTVPSYTSSELSYINNLTSPIKVACRDSNYPIEYFEKGEFKGMMRNVYDIISEKSGIEFEFIKVTEWQKNNNIYDTSDYDCISLIHHNYNWANTHNVILTSQIFNLPISIIKNNNYNDSKTYLNTIVMPKNFYTSKVVEDDHVFNKIIYKDTIEECFESVRKNEAQCTYVNTQIANYYLAYEKYRTFSFASTDYVDSLSIGVTKNTDFILYQIMEKTVNTISSQELNNILLSKANDKATTFSDLVYNYPTTTIGIVLLIMFIVVGLFTAFMIVVNNSKKRIQKALNYDSLTGLYSRQYFNIEVAKFLKSHKDKKYMFIRFDIDNFKMIDVRFGYEEGNKVILYIAHTLSLIMKEINIDCYSRFEADVFCFIVPNDKKIMRQVRDRCILALENYPAGFTLNPSIGIYPINNIDIPVTTMYNYAYMAAESIKGSVEKNFAFYDEKLSLRKAQEKETEDNLRNAIENNEFLMYLQPKFDINTREIIGSEALVRWLHNGTIVPPGDFIPIAEKNGFVVKIDEFMWEEACKTIRYWIDNNMKVLPISVNVSKVNTYDPKLVDKFIRLTRKYSIEPRLLELELTESAYTDNYNQLNEFMEKAKKFGFRFLMDDFGSGYSSLNMLKELSIDQIKLDLRFLSETGDQTKGSSILSCVVKMAKLLNIDVIAEGVESEEQTKFLSGIGCHEGQGYVFSRPIPVNDYNKLLKTNESDTLDGKENENSFDIDKFWNIDNPLVALMNEMNEAIGLFEFDNEENFTALKFNDTYYSMLGLDKSQFILYKQTKKLSNIDEANQNRINEALTFATDTNQIVNTVVEYDKKTNSMFIEARFKLIERLGKKRYFFFSLNDVTDILKQRLELEEFGENQRMIIYNYPTPVTILTISDGKIIRRASSKPLIDALGYGIHEFDKMMKKDKFAIIDPDDLLMVKTAFNTGIKQRLDFCLIFNILTKDGKKLKVSTEYTIKDSTSNSLIYYTYYKFID